jgi:hypothetical protein
MPMKKNETCMEQVWNITEKVEYLSITLDIWNMKSLFLKSAYIFELDKIYPWRGGLTSLKSSTFLIHAFSFAFEWAYNLMKFNYYLCKYLTCKFDDLFVNRIS